MKALLPLDILLDWDGGIELTLPGALSKLYGRLAFPAHIGRPYVISNFVSTLDGVAAFDAKGVPTGEAISGGNDHDSCVMGLLRAASDVIIVGAGTLAASPNHLWTPEHIYPPYAEAYTQLRTGLSRQEPLLNVIVTGHGTIDPSLSLFQSGTVQVLIVTTRHEVTRLRNMDLPAWVRITAGDNAAGLSAQQILEAVMAVRPSASLILIEGGPHLIGTFFAERQLDELFLTLAPQIAGRSKEEDRMGIVAGMTMAPAHPVWSTLRSVRRGENHLFLRYAFESTVNVGG